jgi:hypothetical protein
VGCVGNKTLASHRKQAISVVVAIIFHLLPWTETGAAWDDVTPLQFVFEGAAASASNHFPRYAGNTKQQKQQVNTVTSNKSSYTSAMIIRGWMEIGKKSFRIVGAEAPGNGCVQLLRNHGHPNSLEVEVKQRHLFIKKKLDSVRI